MGSTCSVVSATASTGVDQGIPTALDSSFDLGSSDISAPAIPAGNVRIGTQVPTHRRTPIARTVGNFGTHTERRSSPSISEGSFTPAAVQQTSERLHNLTLLPTATSIQNIGGNPLDPVGSSRASESGATRGGGDLVVGSGQLSLAEVRRIAEATLRKKSSMRKESSMMSPVLHSPARDTDQVSFSTLHSAQRTPPQGRCEVREAEEDQFSIKSADDEDGCDDSFVRRSSMSLACGSVTGLGTSVGFNTQAKLGKMTSMVLYPVDGGVLEHDEAASPEDNVLERSFDARDATDMLAQGNFAEGGGDTAPLTRKNSFDKYVLGHIIGQMEAMNRPIYFRGTSSEKSRLSSGGTPRSSMTFLAHVEVAEIADPPTVSEPCHSRNAMPHVYGDHSDSASHNWASLQGDDATHSALASTTSTSQRRGTLELGKLIGFDVPYTKQLAKKCTPLGEHCLFILQ